MSASKSARRIARKATPKRRNKGVITSSERAMLEKYFLAEISRSDAFIRKNRQKQLKERLLNGKKAGKTKDPIEDEAVFQTLKRVALRASKPHAVSLRSSLVTAARRYPDALKRLRTEEPGLYAVVVEALKK